MKYFMAAPGYDDKGQASIGKAAKCSQTCAKVLVMLGNDGWQLLLRRLQLCVRRRIRRSGFWILLSEELYAKKYFKKSPIVTAVASLGTSVTAP
jgi:hypothetical protein